MDAGTRWTTPPPAGNGDATETTDWRLERPIPIDEVAVAVELERAIDSCRRERRAWGFEGVQSVGSGERGRGRERGRETRRPRGGERGGERGDARGTPREGEEDDPRRGRDVDDDGRWMNGRTGTGATATTTGGAAAGSRGYEREDASVAYGALLRSELFGDVSPPEAYGVTPPASPTSSRYRARRVVVSPIDGSSYCARASPGRNLFRFRDDERLGADGDDDVSV